MPASCTRLDDPHAVEMTCGDREARMAHWEAALFDHGRLTRVQVRAGRRASSPLRGGALSLLG